MKIFGIILIIFGAGSYLYEKIIDPEKFKSGFGPQLRLVRLFSDWGVILFGLLLLIFAPWSCE